LNALRKLEDEKPGSRAKAAWLQRIDTKKAVNKRAKTTWNQTRGMAILVVLVLLISGALVMVRYGDDLVMVLFPEGPASIDPSRENPSLTSMPIAKKPAGSQDQGPRRSEAQTKKGLPRESQRSEAQSEVLPAPKTDPIASAKGGDGTGAVERRNASEDTEYGSKGIDESKFKLEAIVWSNNPKSRFAVVNGQIVRAGGSVDGVSVAHIERDFVALGAGDEKVQLRFTIE
jgi:hypothetical protein